MNDTNNCAVFRDLYPSYINEELEEETITFMKEHLECCSSCRQWKESYKEEGTEEEEINKCMPQREDEVKIIKKARAYLIVGLVVVIALSLWMSFWIVS
jgi:predicted anti-sigma-YlaC factor YlaD